MIIILFGIRYGSLTNTALLPMVKIELEHIDFDLNDIRYLDLIYAPEENPLMKITHWNCVKIGDNIELIHDYPSPLTGRIGFSVVNDNRPQNITLRYTAKNTPLAQSSP